MKLDRGRAALVVIDVQEAFRPVVLDFERVAANVGVLVQGARILGLPLLVTEQYPRGLGETVPEVARHLDGVERLEKTSFSAVGAAAPAHFRYRPVRSGSGFFSARRRR